MKNKHKIKKPLFLKVSLFYFTVALLGQLYVSTAFSAKNAELRAIYDQKNELQREVASLEFEDSKLSTISSLEERAKSLGFVPNQQLIFALRVDGTTKLASANIR